MLGIDTQILMYDGTLKYIQDIIVGDKVMGPDSKPRVVLGTTTGESEMYEIQQSCAMTYIVNDEHILSLKKARSTNYEEDIPFIRSKTNKPYPNESFIQNLGFIEYLKRANSWKYFFRGYKTEYFNFSEQPVLIDPYYLGIWLGDGTATSANITSADFEIEEWLLKFSENQNFYLRKIQTTHSIAANYYLIERNKEKNRILQNLKKLNLIKNKHIPQCYISNSKEIRLQLFAGLIDTDGYYNKKHGYEITLANKTLAYDVKRLADSLGYRTNIREKKTTCKNEETGYNFEGIAWRLTIHGNVWEIPVLIERKKYVHNGKHTHKEEGLSSLKVHSIGWGKYAGIAVDGDHLYCLADGTVEYNGVNKNDLEI